MALARWCGDVGEFDRRSEHLPGSLERGWAQTEPGPDGTLMRVEKVCLPQGDCQPVGKSVLSLGRPCWVRLGIPTPRWGSLQLRGITKNVFSEKMPRAFGAITSIIGLIANYKKKKGF